MAQLGVGGRSSKPPKTLQCPLQICSHKPIDAVFGMHADHPRDGGTSTLVGSRRLVWRGKADQEYPIGPALVYLRSSRTFRAAHGLSEGHVIQPFSSFDLAPSSELS